MAKRVLTRRSKVNIPICAAAVLLCLTMFSTHLTSGIYARYSTTASGSDSARVIKFGQLELTETVNLASQPIIPGVDLMWGGTVTFGGSESATYVFLELEMSKNWVVSDNKTFAIYSDGPAWTVHSGWTFLEKVEMVDEKTKETVYQYVYYRAIEPPKQGEAIQSTAQPIFDDNTAEVPPDTFTAEKMDELKLTTLSGKFRASVVQSNGFDSVEAAWTSLSDKNKDS